MSGADFNFKPTDFSDAGNAHNFSVYYTGLLAYTDALGWLCYDGKRWEPNEHRAVEKAVEFTDEMMCDALVEYNDAAHKEADAKAEAAEGVEGAEERLKKAKKAVASARAYHAHTLRSRNSARIRGMMELSKHDLVVKADKLDADPLTLNTPDGIVDLRTGVMKPHDIDSPWKWCTKITTVSPRIDPEGMKKWADFLQVITCNDNSLAVFLQLVAGMAAIGRIYHEGIIIAHGNGRNGKSTFFNALAAVLGDYAGSIDVKVLTTDRQSKGASLATLRGRRLMIAAELEEHQRLSTSTLKQLASTDRLVIEEKFKQPETVDQTHTLVLYTNHLPRVGSTDNGTWRRLTVVPFNATIPSAGGVQNYADVLVKEAGGAIMTWIVQGAINFVRNNFKLDIPDAVAEVTDAYRERENWLENFINERCTREPNARTGARDLYLEYKVWANDAGEYVRRENDFSDAMVLAGYQKITPKNRKMWVGLRLNFSANYANPCAATG